MEFEEEVQEVVVGGEGRTPETNRPKGSAPRNKEFPQPSESCWSGSALEEVDGLLCPICYHGWSDGGDHAICCLPCGHIFGMSCIKRLLQQQKKSGNCHKCDVGCTVKGIRRLYASQLVTVEKESQKRIRGLEVCCYSGEGKSSKSQDFENEAKWDRAINACMSRQAELENKLDVLEEAEVQTQKPLEAHDGLTCNPIHTTCSVLQKRPGGMRTVLTASSVGMCDWTIGYAEESPILVPMSANCGVCISLSYSPHSSNVGASYCPKVEMSGGVSPSQISFALSSLGGTVVPAQHICLRRIGSSYLKLSSARADMSDVRLCSVIMDLKNGKEMFASGDQRFGLARDEFSLDV